MNYYRYDKHRLPTGESGISGGQSPLETAFEWWGYINLVITLAGAIVSLFVDPTRSISTILIGIRISALAIPFIAFVYWYELCLAPKNGETHCVAGVVNRVVPYQGYDDVEEIFFPYTVTHPNFDIVVKSLYWPLLIENSPYVISSAEDTDDPSQGDPVMRAYVKDWRVCSAAKTSFVCSLIGAVAGVASWNLVYTTALAICAAAGPFCLLFAIFAAIAIPILMAIGGGAIGGQIASASNQPDDSLESENIGVSVGQYVTVRGNIISSGFDNGANVFWFVGSNIPEECSGLAVWGEVSPSDEPFSWELPDGQELNSSPPLSTILADWRFTGYPDGLDGDPEDLEENFCNCPDK